MDNNLNRLYLSITNKCNLNCKHCFRTAGKELKNELTAEEIKKILDSATKSVVSKQVSITGGEPFARNDIFEILKYAYEKDLSVDISTNAILLDEEKIRILEELDNIFYMQISVDGITKESYEYIRGNNTFDKLIKSLNLIKKSKFLEQIDLMMIYLVTPKNYKEIEKLPEFAEKYGFDKIALGEILPFGNGEKNFKDLDTSKYMKDIYSNFYKAKGKNSIPIIDQFHLGFLYNNNGIPSPCTAREGKILAIEPHGDILACPYATDLTFGNIRDYNYNVNEAYKKTRELTKDIFEMKNKKIDCKWFEKCMGGCPLLNKRFNTECDLRCQIKK